MTKITRRTGYYIIGFFTKGRKAFATLSKEKPFKIDKVEGTIEPKPFRCMNNRFSWSDWPKVWFYIQGKIKDIKQTDIDLFNNLYKKWCKKYNRKYEPQFAMPGNDTTDKTRNLPRLWRGKETIHFGDN